MRRRLRGAADSASRADPETEATPKADEDVVHVIDCGKSSDPCLTKEDALAGTEKVTADVVSDAESDFLGLFREEPEVDDQPIQECNKLEASLMQAILGSANYNEFKAKDDGWTALHFAAGNGDSKACRAILSRAEFSEANMKDADGRTVLHWAAASNNVDACHAILAHQGFTEVDAKDTMRGWTALHWAAAEGHLGACQAILDCVDFTEINAHESLGGWTALHLAASAGHSEVCRAILSHCDFTDVEKENINGDTAMTLAVMHGHDEIIELINGYNHWHFYREK
jgi:ankyrin repeat protein